jgi:DNA mismatch repair protein MSH6
MDAVVAVKELGLIFMKGDYAHCGFPEIGYSKYSDSLVSKGYKVARVEQTETPDQMTVRTKGTKDDKTVRREICRITTPGTKTFNMLDSDVANAFSQFLFSIVEKVNSFCFEILV